MQPPIFLANAIGYAMWWLENPGRGPSTGTDIINRLLGRGLAFSRAEARQALQRARANLRATAAMQLAAGAGTVAQAIGFRGRADTNIGLRILINATDPSGLPIGQRSVVVQTTAGEQLDAALARAMVIFNRLNAASRRNPMGYQAVVQVPTPADVAQVLIGHTQGRWA